MICYIIQTTYYILHTTHYTLYTTHNTLHATHYTSYATGIHASLDAMPARGMVEVLPSLAEEDDPPVPRPVNAPNGPNR